MSAIQIALILNVFSDYRTKIYVHELINIKFPVQTLITLSVYLSIY
jgi:hypothetical protein